LPQQNKSSMVWSVERAQAWYAAQGEWKLGVNFIPAYASNQIAMWQDYNSTAVQIELGWAADLHYNALRVFLHDQLYTYQGDAFLDRVDEFLTTAHARGFSTILVLLEGT
jgi:endo-1,4-beta-mannosidase